VTHATLRAVEVSFHLMIGFHTSLACHKLVEEVVGTFLHAFVTSYVVVVSDLGDLSLQKMAADYEFFQVR